MRKQTITVAKSNASMREWNGRYRDDQRGLAWKVRRKGRRVVVDVVDHSGFSSGLGVYRREEGEETINTEQTSAILCMT